MEEQRRRRTRIGIAVVAGVAVVTALGALAVRRMDPAGDCTVERLALPPGDPYSLVFAMDPAARFVVGRSLRTPGTSQLDLLLWSGGRPQRVEVPGEDQVPRGVSATGVVAGTTEIRSAAGPIDLRAWVYRDGRVALLPGTDVTEALAVADNGVVVGTDNRRPVMWRPSATAPSALPTPGGGAPAKAPDGAPAKTPDGAPAKTPDGAPAKTPDGAPAKTPGGAPAEGKANGISADGSTIVGMLRAGSLMRPYVWPAGGTPRELPLPVIDGEPAMEASAQSVTGDWVAGMATTRRSDDGLPVRWNLRTGEVRAFPAYGLAGLTISADGRLTAGDGDRAVLLGGRETVTLRRLAGSAGAGDTARTISADGRSIAGNAGSAPVLWHC